MSYTPRPYVTIEHPEWSKNATIYQINTRQFTPEGTFMAAMSHLPRVKDLGVDILWLMPVQPIGEKNRKGTLGSPYAVADYYGVNPEFGTAEDLRAFISAAHDLGMKVILDWVPNHTAWDSNLVEQHPNWYLRDWQGDFRPTAWWDWGDIIELDYSLPAVREYMTAAMVHWVREFDLDGYRCDVAGFVPTDFWEQVRRELDAVKPVFLLAEWESKDLHAAAFDMTYSWTWYQAMHDICMGRADLNALFTWYSWNEKHWPDDAIRMLFVSNHDKNAWEGTEFENFGAGLHNTVVLSVLGEGMPLVYNGQEAGYDHRLAFFERDPIVWREHEHADLYRRLFALKHENTALWNGRWGARTERVRNDQPNQVLSFVRRNDANAVFAVFNFSGEPHRVTLLDALYEGSYRDFFSGEEVSLTSDHAQMDLPAWSCRVFVR
ncbi:MAG: alpha-glucosidase C-terminal domain-containing protein [Actinomycetales bacterium]|nr:alpha-glucosidase C-terminal domain-containing protein [Actinomycetales bacterium]